MTNGVSVSVIAALLVGPVASMRLERVFSPHVFARTFPRRLPQSRIRFRYPRAIGKNCIQHAHANGSHMIVSLSAV
jgi:hypothetical protein